MRTKGNEELLIQLLLLLSNIIDVGASKGVAKKSVAFPIRQAFGIVWDCHASEKIVDLTAARFFLNIFHRQTCYYSIHSLRPILTLNYHSSATETAANGVGTQVENLLSNL